jgi:hypothetical protein
VPFVVDAPLQNMNARVMQAAVKEAKQQAALVSTVTLVHCTAVCILLVFFLMITEPVSADNCSVRSTACCLSAKLERLFYSIPLEAACVILVYISCLYMRFDAFHTAAYSTAADGTTCYDMC